MGEESIRFRILVVDDHPLARDAVRTALGFCSNAQPEIVGEAADGATAIELARRLEPDIVTMDIGLPDISGLEVICRLKAERLPVKMVVVTLHEDRRYREEAAKAGAVSYITKEHLIDELPCCLDHLAKQLPASGGGHEHSSASALQVREMMARGQDEPRSSSG